MKRTPAIVLLLLFAATPVTALSGVDTDPAELTGQALYWSIVGAPVEIRFQALLAQSGLVLTPVQQQAFDELLVLLSQLEDELVQEIPTGWTPKWFTLGFEGCTGTAACGGTYTNDESTHNSWNTFNNNNTVNNSNNTVCSNNSYWTVTYVLSDNPQFCHLIISNGFNVDNSSGGIFQEDSGGADCIDASLPCYLIEARCGGTPLDKGRVCRLDETRPFYARS